MLALPLRSCKSRASLLEPEERARGVWGAQRQLHVGDSSGSAGGAPRGKVGGRKGAWRRDGGRDRRCQWAAGVASSTALRAAAESPHSPPVGERHRETPYTATAEPRVQEHAPCSVPCLPTTLSVPPCAHLPVTGFDGFDHHGLFGVHLRAPLLWAGLCRGRTQGVGPQGHVAWGHSMGVELGSLGNFSSLGLTPPQLIATPKQVPLHQGLCVTPVCPQPASLATTPQEGHLPQK